MELKIKYIKPGRRSGATWNIPWDDTLGDPVEIARNALKEHDILAAVIYDRDGNEIARVTRDA